MHPNPIYRSAEAQQNIGFARERGFGTLCLTAPDPTDAPLLSHIPFLLSEDGSRALLHLVRSNPIARMLKSPAPAVISVTGPDAYVSPDWYEVPDQVPTWNYTAVHLRGTLIPLDPSEIRATLDQQSEHTEANLLPKAPWTTDKMTPEVLEKMMRQILPFAMDVTEITGTWKLSQNKPDAVRISAAQHMDATGFGSEPRDMAALMLGVPKKTP
jgi:transcriptional regulator